MGEIPPPQKSSLALSLNSQGQAGTFPGINTHGCSLLSFISLLLFHDHSYSITTDKPQTLQCSEISVLSQPKIHRK